ncbi:MAG: hypothetical protein M5U19_18390 [Microthrixaceae bacterium]|nr:hypothetical protein [Microthrixaceae bacterium]
MGRSPTPAHESMLVEWMPLPKKCISMVEPRPLSMLVVPWSCTTLSGPSSTSTSNSFSAISSSAWSQLRRSHWPPPRSPTRFIG